MREEISFSGRWKWKPLIIQEPRINSLEANLLTSSLLTKAVRWTGSQLLFLYFFFRRAVTSQHQPAQYTGLIFGRTMPWRQRKATYLVDFKAKQKQQNRRRRQFLPHCFATRSRLPAQSSRWGRTKRPTNHLSKKLFIAISRVASQNSMVERLALHLYLVGVLSSWKRAEFFSVDVRV